LRGRCEKVCYLLHTFRKVQLRLLAQAITVDFRLAGDLGVDIEEGVVSGVFGFANC
jgi:hypothetical protein